MQMFYLMMMDSDCVYLIEEMISPLIRDEADVDLISRMIKRANALCEGCRSING